MTTPSPIERELKVAAEDAAAVVRVVEDAGAARALPRHWERNWVLDRAGELVRARSLLRVRDRWNESGEMLGAVVTVKRPLESAVTEAGTETSGIKERLEHEIVVPDAAGAIHLFLQLEYRVVRRYHKVRTAWHLEGHEVVLDETPIGQWVEIEGPDPARVARRLGLPERGDLRSYLSIYEAERVLHPELPLDMVFAGSTDVAEKRIEIGPPGFEGLDAPATTDSRAADPGAPAGRSGSGDRSQTETPD